MNLKINQYMKLKTMALLLSGLIVSLNSEAGIVAAKTRVIFNEGQREQSLMLANSNDYPIILQTWVDRGEADPEVNDVPFFILPPLVKMRDKGIQGIRIVYNATALPGDVESVYWLNLYEIPSSKKVGNQDAYLSLAMNTQLKLFYRPKQLLKMELNNVVEQLKFKLIYRDQHWYIECENPSAYHISFLGMTLSHETEQIHTVAEMDMMSYPKQSKMYRLDGSARLGSGYKLEFNVVDDEGYTRNFKRGKIDYAAAIEPR